MTKILVHINQVMTSRARDMAEQVLATDTMARENYTKLAAQDRYFFGYLGDLVMEMVLREYGIRHTMDRRLDGQSDDADFQVWHKGNPAISFKLDVKTASKPSHQRIMMPQAQFINHQHDLYIGVRLLAPARLNGTIDAAEVCGWASKEDVQVWPVADFGHGVPTLSCLIMDLQPIGQLLARLERI